MVIYRALAAISAFLAAPLCYAQADAPDWAGAAFGSIVQGPHAGGAITADDLVRLRDLGGVSLSPDGKKIVFPVYQAVPELNEYVQRWFIAPVDGTGAPKAFNFDGGQPISTDIHGLPYAYIPKAYARWSPDGATVAVQKLVDSRVELWVINVNTGGAHRVTDGQWQVVSFAWNSAGYLLYQTGLNRQRFESAMDAEARNGWLLDGRVQLYASRVRPTPPNCTRTPEAIGCDGRLYVFDKALSTRDATNEERAEFQGLLRMQKSSTTSIVTRADGAAVQAPAADAQYAKAEMPIRHLTTDAFGGRTCDLDECRGMYIQQFGWAREGRTIWFVKLESSLKRSDGIPRDMYGLYEWNPETGKVTTISRAQGVVSDCSANDVKLVCVQESAKEPQRVVSIDLQTHRIRTVADPNSMIASKELPRVREIITHDRDGNIGFAQIVYPNDYRPGNRYPLVVTQYMSRGFLRGQVGNEYPIYPLAAAGFVVMSVEWTRFTKLEQTEGYDAWNRFYAAGGRELVWSAMEGAIDQLIDEGLVDPKRIALTGLSGGAENVHYVLQRSKRFAAAIASSAMQDITFFAIASEDGDRVQLMKNFNSKSIIPPPGNALYDLAWSNKPQSLTTPLLINVGEYEALVGFEGIAAIKQVRGPLEVRISPMSSTLSIIQPR